MKQLFVTLSLLMLLNSSANAESSSIELPNIGDSSQTVISSVMEKHIGRAFMRSIYSAYKLIDDPEITEYIQDLGSQLTSQGQLTSQPFHFFVVDNPSINAFAAPGGFIGIHSGLILSAESESELASVLAHEIAHITQRHMARAYEEATQMNLPATAALIAAILLGGQNIEITEAAIATTLAATTQQRLNFTRSNEKEADRAGMQILADAGFSPKSMPQFFERLHQASRYYENGLPEFLRTHPITISRIADSQNRAAQYTEQLLPDSSSFHLIRAKIHLLKQDTPEHAAHYFSQNIKSKKKHNLHAEHYGYALALTNKGDFQQAKKLLLQLVKNDWERSYYLTALANNELAQGNNSEAEKYFNKTLNIYPFATAPTLLFAQALIKIGKPDKAASLLYQYKKQKKMPKQFYSALAEAEQQLNHPAESHQAMAEYYYQLYDYHSALTQLNQAKKHSNNQTVLLSTINSRIEQVKDEIRRETETLEPEKTQRP